jgi:hypothetical protein
MEQLSSEDLVFSLFTVCALWVNQNYNFAKILVITFAITLSTVVLIIDQYCRLVLAVIMSLVLRGVFSPLCTKYHVL